MGSTTIYSYFPTTFLSLLKTFPIRDGDFVNPLLTILSTLLPLSGHEPGYVSDEQEVGVNKSLVNESIVSYMSRAGSDKSFVSMRRIVAFADEDFMLLCVVL